MFLGTPRSIGRLISANALDPLAELFIHPEVLDTSLWFGGKHWWTDEQQQYVFTMSASAGPIMPMWYNTNLVSQADLDGITSVFDYLDPKWKGKIVALPPLNRGPGDTYFGASFHPEIGSSWIDAFVDPDFGVTFSNEGPFIIDGIANGKFAMGIAIGAAGRDLDMLAEQGAPVQTFPCTVSGACVKQLKEGSVMSASEGQNNLMVLTNQPHPNSAKLFVNWFLSKEGQTIMHRLSADPDQTLRTDVTDLGKTLPSERRDPGRGYWFFRNFPALRDDLLHRAYVAPSGAGDR